ncbi:hypothetical protein EDD86DRAFT_244623 [Gorgonomyces haynaldii]|nr:hypothetical protein EDD86DRAFT_244623 [Gorgonomyces haynaldii]
MKFLVLSPNEQERLDQENRRQLHINRLMQVRKQDKIIAQNRRTKFREQCHKEWTKIDIWLDNKEKEQQILDELIQQVFQQLWGQSYGNAQEMEIEKQESVQELRNLFAKRHFQEEHLRRIEPWLTKTALLRAVHHQEHARSQMVVERFREEMKHDAGIWEIQSQPLNRLQRNTAYRFDETHFHMEHQAVRVDRAVQRGATVQESAAIIAEKTKEMLKIKEEKENNFLVSADIRHRQAAHDRKEEFIKKLGLLQKEDRQRKQQNSGSNAKTYMPFAPKFGEKVISEKFQSQFRADAQEDEPRPYTTATKAIKAKRYHLL